MIEMLAIRAALGKAWGALSSIPWQVWMIGALVVAIPINGCVQHGRGYDAGREEVLNDLRAKAAEKAEQAAQAKTQADDNATERADEFEREQEVLNDAIEEAESTGGNALDGLFDGLSG